MIDVAGISLSIPYINNNWTVIFDMIIGNYLTLTWYVRQTFVCFAIYEWLNLLCCSMYEDKQEPFPHVFKEWIPRCVLKIPYIYPVIEGENI